MTTGQVLATLFPSAIRVAGGPIESARGTLFPEEEALLVGSAAKRRRDFEAGRFFARSALAQLGVAPAPIPARDRRPIWPAGILGTIAHTPGRCGAAVARAEDAAGLGLDVERAESVTENLHRHLFTPGERTWLSAQPTARQAHAATLLFSAKEAFYKSLAEVRPGFVGFHEVRIELGDDDAFVVAADSDSIARTLEPFETRGRLAFERDWIWTGVTLLRT